MTDEIDRKLAALFAAPDRAPDQLFALRVKQMVLADDRLRAARRRAWRRFAAEGAAGASVLLAFLVLGRLQPPGSEGVELQFFSPAMTAVILLGLWALVTLRPGAAGRA